MDKVKKYLLKGLNWFLDFGYVLTVMIVTLIMQYPFSYTLPVLLIAAIADNVSRIGRSRGSNFTFNTTVESKIETNNPLTLFEQLANLSKLNKTK